MRIWRTVRCLFALSLAAASIRYRIALGPEAGRRTLTLKEPGLTRSDTAPKALTADLNGFSLNAGYLDDLEYGRAREAELVCKFCRFIIDDPCRWSARKRAVCAFKLAASPSYQLHHSNIST